MANGEIEGSLSFNHGRRKILLCEEDEGSVEEWREKVQQYHKSKGNKKNKR